MGALFDRTGRGSCPSGQGRNTDCNEDLKEDCLRQGLTEERAFPCDLRLNIGIGRTIAVSRFSRIGNISYSLWFSKSAEVARMGPCSEWRSFSSGKAAGPYASQMASFCPERTRRPLLRVAAAFARFATPLAGSQNARQANGSAVDQYRSLGAHPRAD